MRLKQQAFTLIELLVCIAIISVLAGLIVPAFAHARMDGRKTVSISNLRQCGMALLIYSQDYDGIYSVPPYKVAKLALKDEPTCDPNDLWRPGCKEDWGQPLVGSYGYVRGVSRYATDDGWDQYLNWTDGLGHPGSLLISVFYSDTPLAPFHGETPILGAQCGPGESRCMWPNHVLRFRLDGSAKSTSGSEWSINSARTIMDWGGLFFNAE